MKKTVLSFLIYLAHSVSAQDQTFLIVLAHPDDETAMGHVLAKLTKRNQVILITATDGRYGIRTHAGIPKGDSLAIVRARELRCACRELGVDSLIMLGYHDGMGMVTGVGEYFKQSRSLRDTLEKLIARIDPDFLITFGPDGDTGHSDHRIIGNIITEIVLRKEWVDRFPLYYLAWNQQQSNVMGGLGYVADKYMNISVSYNEEEEKKNWLAAECHWSQFTQKELAEMKEIDKKDTTNTIFFRRFVVLPGLKKDF